jgi:hypothetical protein
MVGNVIDQVSVNGLLMASIKELDKQKSDLAFVVTDNDNTQEVVNKSIMDSIEELSFQVQDGTANVFTQIQDLAFQVQDLTVKVVNLTTEVANLNTKYTELADLSNQMAGQLSSNVSMLGEYAGSFFNDILVKVEGGVAYMKGLAVETLKIGTPEKPTGITLYDETNGNPYCFSVANGTTKTMLGECGTTETTPTGDNLTYSPTDLDAPIITLDGNTLVSLDVGSTYVESGAFAQDDVDGGVTVVMSGAVDTNTPGTYTITYTATDSAGNVTTTTRTVTVGSGTSTDTTIPSEVITTPDTTTTTETTPNTTTDTTTETTPTETTSDTTTPSTDTTPTPEPTPEPTPTEPTV